VLVIVYCIYIRTFSLHNAWYVTGMRQLLCYFSFPVTRASTCSAPVVRIKTFNDAQRRKCHWLKSVLVSTPIWIIWNVKIFNNSNHLFILLLNCETLSKVVYRVCGSVDEAQANGHLLCRLNPLKFFLWLFLKDQVFLFLVNEIGRPEV
jgi:hypothetical protein